MRPSILFLALAACSASSGPSTPSIDLYAAGDSPGFVLADTNGDGIRDLVVSFAGASPGIAVRRGDVRGSFAAADRVLVGATTLAVFDADSDGTADLVIGDGQHIGLLPAAHGPMRVLGACRERVLGANEDGVVTTDGRDLVLHSWDLELARPLEVEPLVPLRMDDVDADGRADLLGTALGRAAVRRATRDGFGAVRLLGEEPAQGMTVADTNGDGETEIVVWSNGRAKTWTPDGVPISAFDVPLGTIAVAAGDLDGDGRPELLAATPHTIEIVGGHAIDGPWQDVRQIAVHDAHVIVADAGARVLAVVRP